MTQSSARASPVRPRPSPRSTTRTSAPCTTSARSTITEYLVLELLEGETLAARLERGPLALSQVLRFGIEIADALEAAHRHGIVHRDLKPGQRHAHAGGHQAARLRAREADRRRGRAGALDARHGAGDGHSTGHDHRHAAVHGPRTGTGCCQADARTDIFALGTILHEMATGRRAFEATTQASLIAKILETEPPVVSRSRPSRLPRSTTSSRAASRRRLLIVGRRRTT